MEKDGKNFREALVAYYKVHNPYKLSSVDQTLKQYKNKENDLIRALENKYKQPFWPTQNPSELQMDRERIDLNSFSPSLQIDGPPPEYMSEAIPYQRLSDQPPEYPYQGLSDQAFSEDDKNLLDKKKLTDQAKTMNWSRPEEIKNFVHAANEYLTAEIKICFSGGNPCGHKNGEFDYSIPLRSLYEIQGNLTKSHEVEQEIIELAQTSHDVRIISVSHVVTNKWNVQQLEKSIQNLIEIETSWPGKVQVHLTTDNKKQYKPDNCLIQYCCYFPMEIICFPIVYPIRCYLKKELQLTYIHETKVESNEFEKYVISYFRSHYLPDVIHTWDPKARCENKCYCICGMCCYACGYVCAALLSAAK